MYDPTVMMPGWKLVLQEVFLGEPGDKCSLRSRERDCVHSRVTRRSDDPCIQRILLL